MQSRTLNLGEINYSANLPAANFACKFRSKFCALRACAQWPHSWGSQHTAGSMLAPVRMRGSTTCDNCFLTPFWPLHVSSVLTKYLEAEIICHAMFHIPCAYLHYTRRAISYSYWQAIIIQPWCKLIYINLRLFDINFRILAQNLCKIYVNIWRLYKKFAFSYFEG